MPPAVSSADPLRAVRELLPDRVTEGEEEGEEKGEKK